jgi:hypothetical protein
MKLGTHLTISIADVCLVVIALFVALAYFNGWGA